MTSAVSWPLCKGFCCKRASNLLKQPKDEVWSGSSSSGGHDMLLQYRPRTKFCTWDATHRDSNWPNIDLFLQISEARLALQQNQKVQSLLGRVNSGHLKPYADEAIAEFCTPALGALLCCNQTAAGEGDVCQQTARSSAAGRGSTPLGTDRLGSLVESGHWEPWMRFLFHCHPADAAIPHDAAYHPKFSYLAFPPLFLTIFSSQRHHPKWLRVRSGDRPASYSMFIWTALLIRCSLSSPTKPHSCSNAWLFLGRVLERDGNEHLQTLWTVSWINGRKLKDAQTTGIIDFITISTAPSAVASKRSSSFINWLFQGSKACQGNN